MKTPSALAVAAFVGLAAPAAAPAQAPAGGDFGGGTLAADPYRNPTNSMTLGAAVAQGRATVRVILIGRCASADLQRTVPITPEGDFAIQASGAERSAASRARSTYRLTLAGRITAEGGAGTARARLTRRVPGRRTRSCTTRTMAWTVRPSAGAGAGDPTPAPAGATLLGTSAQRFGGVAQPLALRVSADGRRVEATLFNFVAPCRRDEIRWDFERKPGVNLTRPADVAPDGRFRSVERYRTRYSDTIEHVTVVFAGRFTAGGATGTLSLTSRWTRRGGRALDTCTSGRRAWTARA